MVRLLSIEQCLIVVAKKWLYGTFGGYHISAAARAGPPGGIMSPSDGGDGRCGMDARAGMLAALFERSMGLGDDRGVEDVQSGTPGGLLQEELHIRVGRTPGRAVRCPECGALCGVHDARERTWRHPGIWQYRTVVHCRVPRADCPEHGVRTVGAPWEVRPNSHLAALFEAQVLVAALSGSTVRAISSRTGEPEGRVWAMLSRAVSEARAGADYGDVTRVAVDDTARARGQGYISVMADLDGRRVVAVTEGRDRGAPSRLRGRLEAGGGDRSAVAEVTRDMAEAYSRGCAEAMPNAHQTVDRFHVMQPFSKATEQGPGRRGQVGRGEEGAAQGHQVRPAEAPGEPHGPPGGDEGAALEGAPAHRPRLRDGRGDEGRLRLPGQGGGGLRARPAPELDDAPGRGRDEARGEDGEEGAGGGPRTGGPPGRPTASSRA